MHFELKTLLNPYTVVTMPGFNNYYFQRNKPKIPKISPGAIFEGLISGGAYIQRGLLRREICITKLIRLTYSWKEI